MVRYVCKQKSTYHKETTIKYIRRKELDAQTRLTIIVLALSLQGTYGEMTALARQYSISRSFLYQLVGMALICLQELFNTEKVAESPVPLLNLESALVFQRLECKTSIGSISETLRVQGYKHSSVGMISERLQYLGENLPHTLSADGACYVFYLSDEIFALGHPILVTIDPVSTAILRIELAPNRKADTWENHFKAIGEQQFIAKGLASDRGTGLMQGYQAANSDSVWCSDHFHEFRGLTQLRSTLEKQAYATIAAEDERQRIFDNARSEENLEKRLQQLHEAKMSCEQKITEYQHVSDILDILFPLLYFFDLKTGKPRQQQAIKEDILILMDLLDELSLSKLQEQTKKIREHIDSICTCYQQVEGICQELSNSIPEEILDYIGLAWQHDHQSHQHKGKVKKHHQAECAFWLDVAKPLLGEEAEVLINQAFEQFNGMVRTSSLIEMVNSQIRPYLNNCKGQITQAHLNLIMFYHNHHLYKSGKRKNKAPIEILTGKKLEKPWYELLFDTVSQAQ